MLALSASTEMEGRGNNVKKVRKWWSKSLLINNPLMRGFGLLAGFLTHINMYTQYDTHHTQTQPQIFLKKIYLSFIQPLCYTFLFPLFVSESEETSLSVSAFSLSCACTHTHTPTHQYSTCTDTQPPAPTETKTHTYTTTHTRIDCLLLLWWLRAVKTPLLSLPLSPKQLDWACLCRFTETAVYPPSFFLSSHSPLQFASWFCFLELFSPCPHTF